MEANRAAVIFKLSLNLEHNGCRVGGIRFFVCKALVDFSTVPLAAPLSRARACGAVVKSDFILPHYFRKAVFVKNGELVHRCFPIVSSATPF